MFAVRIDNNTFGDINPREFLEWAQKDIEGKDNRAIGNALGNIKKSIHCRMDEILFNTHIRFCKGWNPLANTETKLLALNHLGIRQNLNIVRLLTDIRNSYEHHYRLIDEKGAVAYLEITKMWLEDSYRNYSFYPVGINWYDSTFKSFSQSLIKGKRSFSVEFIRVAKFDFLWSSKKEVHEFKNGKLKIVKFADMPWESMAKYEGKLHFPKQGQKPSPYCLTPAELTNLYKKALKFAKT